MAEETSRDSVDPNYKAKRHKERAMALEALSEAKFHLDNAMRGSESHQARSLVSTIYNLVRESADLILILEDVDGQWEHADAETKEAARQHGLLTEHDPNTCQICIGRRMAG